MIAFPEMTDRLFREGRNSFTSCLGWARGQRYGYTEGYRRAAEVLFEDMARSRSGLETLVFPLIFTWRQCIELLLKETIDLGRQVLGEGVGYPYGHDLVKLWNVARPLIVRFEPAVASDCDAVESLLKELCEVDPDSAGFRYPEDRQGRATLENALERVDVENLHRVLGGVATFLQCGVAALTNAREWRLSREAEDRDRD